MRRIALFVVLVGSLSGCQRQKETVFLDTAWNRDYAMNACEAYKKSYNVPCFQTPEQIATELRLRFASAIRQTSACRDVTLSDEPLSEKNLKVFEEGWNLSFNVGIDGGVVDYSKSDWQILDNKTKKQFGEGPLRDAVEAATRICTVATGQGGAVSP